MQLFPQLLSQRGRHAGSHSGPRVRVGRRGSITITATLIYSGVVIAMTPPHTLCVRVVVTLQSAYIPIFLPVGSLWKKRKEFV